MFTVYLDESGIHDSSNYMFIAGYIGNEKQWKRMGKEWQEALGKRKGFHANKLRADSRTERLIKKLGVLPKKCKLTPVFIGVKVSDYADMIVHGKAGKIFKGYLAALGPLVYGIANWLPPNERVELVFEQQKEYQGSADIILSILKWGSKGKMKPFMTRDGKPKLAKVSFVPKSSTILTQPADCLAYALLHFHRDPTSEKSRIFSPILPIDKDREFYGICETINRKGIRGIMKLFRNAITKFNL